MENKFSQILELLLHHAECQRPATVPYTCPLFPSQGYKGSDVCLFQPVLSYAPNHCNTLLFWQCLSGIYSRQFCNHMGRESCKHTVTHAQTVKYNDITAGLSTLGFKISAGGSQLILLTLGNFIKCNGSRQQIMGV